MDCFCRLSAASPPPGLSCGGSGGSTGLSGDTLRVLAAWDDQADVGDAEEDLTCSRPVALEVLDKAWDGPVHHAAAACQVEVHPLDPMDPSRWASA